MVAASRAASPVDGGDRISLYRLLAEPQRVQILALCQAEELSVGELATLLSDSQPQVSRKVAPLRSAGLLSARREGPRTWLQTTVRDTDAVLEDALREGRRLCERDGSLARLPKVLAQREERSQAFFDAGHGVATFDAAASAGATLAPGHLAHLSALSPLLPGNELALDMGTGEGLLLDVLSPLYRRVIAVDRSPAQLARCASRVAERGFSNVSLIQGSYDDVSLVQRVDAFGGADLVFAARALHHHAKPAVAISALARLLRRGGHLVLLEYVPHQDDGMRERQGDVWLGLASEELSAACTAAGLQPGGTVDIPSALHREGPDSHLEWHAVVARRPLASPSAV